MRTTENFLLRNPGGIKKALRCSAPCLILYTQLNQRIFQPDLYCEPDHLRSLLHTRH
jgi:hypothetical protein